MIDIKIRKDILSNDLKTLDVIRKGPMSKFSADDLT